VPPFPPFTARWPPAASVASVPQVTTHYDQLGGDAGIRALVDRFYDLMDTAPEAANIRTLHARSLKVSREKLYKFMSGWTGGPQLYAEEFGHPRLRMRHFPFAIGERERDEWLWCMDQAMAQHEAPEELKAFLRERLQQLADHMRNQPG
jgi:hemoglobin